MVMVPLARRSIQPRPSEPPVTPMSALTSPPCVPVLSTRMVVPDQISTQPVDFRGLPGRVDGVAPRLERRRVRAAIGRIVRRDVAGPRGFHEPVDHDRAALEVNQVGTWIEASAAHHAVVTDDEGAPGLDRDRAAAWASGSRRCPSCCRPTPRGHRCPRCPACPS